jgi:uncharacterized protein YecT (DUF1311 family)
MDMIDMRAMKLITLQFILLSPMLAYAVPDIAVQTERELRVICSESEFSQAGMWDCLAKKAKESQETLRRAEEKAAHTLSKWDEDHPYIKTAKAKLAASNKAFVKYREAQCAFAYSLGGGAIGSALDMRRFSCIAELNNRRAEQLRNAVSDMPLK